MHKGILVNFFGDTFLSSFSTSSEKFSKFDTSNVTFFQVKVLGKNIKGNMLVKYFTKVAARFGFTRLRVIKRINIAH